MTEIHIFRHGETEWNIEGRAQGSKESKLTALGRKQAEEARAKIKNVNFDIAFSSTLERAYQTAEILLAGQNTPINQLDALREIDMGTWEGMKYEDIEHQYPVEHNNFWNRPSQFKPDGGESFQELEIRAMAIFDQITTRYRGKTILLTSHAGFIKTLINSLLAKPTDEIWGKPYTSNLSHSIVMRAVDGKYHVKLYCDHEWCEDM